MRLLIVETGISTLPAAIKKIAEKLHPKPDMVSIMNLHLERLNISEFKHMLYHLAPDTIILNPPDETPGLNNWGNLLKEVIRHVSVTSGRLLFVSSFEVLGDSHQRTEDAIEMPLSNLGTFLFRAETMVQEGTARHYIIRLPYITEDKRILAWLHGDTDYKDQWFNLITIEDAAKAIVARIQTGLYGKYHITPNDRLSLSDLVDCGVSETRILDKTLSSKYAWSTGSSEAAWYKLKALLEK